MTQTARDLPFGQPGLVPARGRLGVHDHVAQGDRHLESVVCHTIQRTDSIKCQWARCYDE